MIAGETSLEDVLAELRETETRQRALLAVLPDLMFRLHRDGTYLEFAGDLTRLATPADELLGSNIHDILPGEVATALMGCAARAIEAGGLCSVEYELRTLAGELREFEARVIPVREDEVLTIVRDITERKQAELALRESRARIVDAADAERRRIERNLHDGAQQRLVTMKLNLHLVAQKLESDPAAARLFLAVAQEELDTSLAEIRRLARGLDPPLLAADGLAVALHDLAERSVVPVDLDELPSSRLPESLEAAVYYVVAESLANATKHAQAARVRVRVAVDGAAVVAEISDDGIGGADVDAGTGIRGLADRVAGAGGELSLESPAGGGTRVRASLPLPTGV